MKSIGRNEMKRNTESLFKITKFDRNHLYFFKHAWEFNTNRNPIAHQFSPLIETDIKITSKIIDEKKI